MNVYLGMFLGGDEGPHCQPDRPLPVDVEVLDLLPQSSRLALQALQSSRVVSSYFWGEKISTKRQHCIIVNIKIPKLPSPDKKFPIFLTLKKTLENPGLDLLTILKKLNSVRIVTVILLEFFLLCLELLQVLCTDFFYHTGGRNTENRQSCHFVPRRRILGLPGG